MRYYYAQINGGSVCTGVLDTFAPIVAANMIAITSLDPSLIGKRWTGSAWVAV
jgi:hypothetical protein